MEDVIPRVVRVMRLVLATDLVDANSTIGKPARWDSLKHVSLIVAIEKEFQIRVELRQIAKLKSVLEIADYIRVQTRAGQ